MGGYFTPRRAKMTKLKHASADFVSADAEKLAHGLALVAAELHLGNKIALAKAQGKPVSEDWLAAVDVAADKCLDFMTHEVALDIGDSFTVI
jgi:hypothetical protein